MKMAETAVYSFHKTSTREYIEKVAVKKLGAKSAKVVAEMKYGLKNQYGHHRKDEVEVFVDVWRIEPSSSKAKKDDDDDDDDEKDEMFEQNLRDLAANIEELQLSARQRKDKERNKNSRKNSDNRRKG